MHTQIDFLIYTLFLVSYFNYIYIYMQIFNFLMNLDN